MNQSQTQEWNFKLEDDSDQLEQILAKVINDSVARTKANTIELEQEIARTMLKARSCEQKCEKRSDITRKLSERCDKRRDALEKAQMAYRVARTKSRNLGFKLSELNESIRNTQNLLNRQKEFVDNFAGIYTEDAFKNRAFMVMAIREMIDPTHQVSLKNDTTNKRLTLTWRTGDIYIKDGQGGFYDFNFGKFDVTVVLKYANGSRVVDTYIQCAGDNTYVRADSYVHPHIKGNGEPCLGNVSRMLIEHMANQDVAQVICVITEYLCHYNERDPFVKLREFGVANEQDMPNLNTINQYLEFDDGEKRECGLSGSECFVLHTVGPDGGCIGRGLPSEWYEQIENTDNNLKTIKEFFQNGQSDI